MNIINIKEINAKRKINNMNINYNNIVKQQTLQSLELVNIFEMTNIIENNSAYSNSDIAIGINVIITIINLSMIIYDKISLKFIFP